MILSRRTVLGASVAGAAIAVGCSPKPAAAPDLTGLLSEISVALLKESPEYATSLAVGEDQAGGPYMDRVSDVSMEGFRAHKALLTDSLTKLRALNRDALADADKVSLDVVTTAFDNEDKALAFEAGGGATAPYVVSQLTGVYTNVPDFLDSQHPITSKANVDAYLARLSGYAKQLDQQTARIGTESSAGYTPPDFAIDKALVQLRGFGGLAPNATVLVQSLVRRLPSVAEIPEADRAGILTQAETIVRDEVLPAYARQIAELEKVRPTAVHDAGCYRLPNGEALYAAGLRYYTTTEMTPDEIHNMGVELVRSINAETDTILKAQGLTRGTIAERVASIARRPGQVYPNTEAGRAQLLADLNAQVAAIKARMPEVCGVQAKAALDIKRIPAYTEAGAPGGYYQGAALDGSRPGAYYINLRDTRENPKFGLPTLTYHEGIPGHHWQIAIQQESTGLPFIRSALLGFNAYAEGWGLYAEQLADEMGMYANDPFGRVGYLQSAAFRASRLVVDTGMHAKRWTREQAIQSMVEATGDAPSSVTTEIERYAVWPGQACGYMVGRQYISKLREDAKTALGDKFDIKGFHDVVLTNGSVPLSVLKTLVEGWQAGLAAA